MSDKISTILNFEELSLFLNRKICSQGVKYSIKFEENWPVN